MTDKIIVTHSDGKQEIFRPRLIGQAIVKETGIDEELALKIQKRITKKIYKLKEEGLEELQTTQIRAEVSSQLLKEGISEEPYVIIKESDIMNILEDYDKNNANQVRTAGALEYSLFEMIAKRYMTTQYSNEWREAREYGLVYNHDAAQELYKGLNCFTLDPRFVFKKGLRTYGDNHVGVVSKPPKHFDTALEICEQTLGLATPYIAGGVSIACFNYMLAPYMENLSYESVYQSLQGFMFQMNQSHKNRGSQSMFSSITLDMTCPEFLKNQKAIGPGGVELTKTYADFDKEARLILDIITNISFNGDGEGKPIFFPNLIYNIDNANLRDFENVFDLSAKFSLPYFCSAKNNNVDYQSTLGCRSALPNNWTGDPNIDCMGTGNSVYTTISLPAVALKAKEDNRDFYDVLEEMLYLVHDYNLNRLDWIKKLWYDYHVADFMIQEDDNGVPMYRLEDATIVVGYLGMSECLEILGYGPLSRDNNDKCQEIMKFMKKHTDEWKQNENLRWGLFQTPCESAAGKLATKMVNRFGFKNSYAKGTLNAPYYTNSNHIAVDNSIDIIERIKLEGANQPLGPAGNIMNLYLGESYAQASALASLCEKIRDHTGAYFFAFTSEFSLCPQCFSTFKGNISECPFCHVETDTFSRITGYVTNTKTWNKGKISEFKERKRY